MALRKSGPAGQKADRAKPKDSLPQRMRASIRQLAELVHDFHKLLFEILLLIGFFGILWLWLPHEFRHTQPTQPGVMEVRQ